MPHKVHRPHLSTASDARAVRTRAAIRAAFLGLLEHRPFEQITSREIAQSAAVGYVTFFRHYPTNEALLNEIAAEQMRRLVELTLPVFDAENLHAASRAMWVYVNEHRALWKTLLTGGAAAALRAELMQISQEIAKKRASPGAWLPSDIANNLVVGSTIELLSWWLRQSRPMPIERVSEIYRRAIVEPILTLSEEPTPKRGR